MASQNDPPASATHVVAPGALIAERYRVEATLGEGGMGIVYLAEHVHIRKRVAIKVLLPKWTGTPEMIARFEREAVAAGAIAHPNVAAATDFGRLIDGSFFLVLEYLEGRTLRAELEGGALTPARTLQIARGIALGVGAAHAKGIVHRDLKPENVMLVARGGDPDFVKVLDFGIARLDGVGRPVNGQALTSAGAILGTPGYMAPEQVVGQAVDARPDLYAVGVMIFEMLTGSCPFSGGAVTVLRQHVTAEIPELPANLSASLDPRIGTILRRLLAKRPENRFANASDLIAALDECSKGYEPSGPPGSTRSSLELAGGMTMLAAKGRTRSVLAQLRAIGGAARRAFADPDAVLRQAARGRILVARCVRTVVLAGLKAIAVAQRALANPGVLRAYPTRARLIGAVLVTAVVTTMTVALVASGRPRAPTSTAPPARTEPARAADLGSIPSPLLARPEEVSVAVLDGQFADHIEQGRPMGDVRGISAAHKVIYWIDVANTGEPAQVTLVWILDGKEVERQSLEVGHTAHWRTWGARRVGGAHKIDVQVVDASGRSLKEDSVALGG
jgi:hypothetical protein